MAAKSNTPSEKREQVNEYDVKWKKKVIKKEEILKITIKLGRKKNVLDTYGRVEHSARPSSTIKHAEEYAINR